MQQLFYTIKQLWDLVCVRSTPISLPSSYSLLVFFVFSVGLAQTASQYFSFGRWEWSVTGLVVMVSVLVRALPFIVLNKTDRLVQSLLAFLGTDLLITLPLLVALWLWADPSSQLIADESAQVPIKESQLGAQILVILYFCSISWRMLVNAYIYIGALGVKWLTALGLSSVTMIIQLILSQFILQLLRS